MWIIGGSTCGLRNLTVLVAGAGPEGKVGEGGAGTVGGDEYRETWTSDYVGICHPQMGTDFYQPSLCLGG